MVPPKNMRTYSRGNNSTINCFDALNILFGKDAKNGKKIGRKIKSKKKIRVKELSAKIKTVLSDESILHVNVNDTFDRLLRSSVTKNYKKPKDSSIHVLTNNITTSVVEHKSSECMSTISKYYLHSSKNNTDTIDVTNNTLSWFNHPTKSGERISNDLEIEKISKNKEPQVLKSSVSSEGPSMLLRSMVQLSNTNKGNLNEEKNITTFEGNISLSFNNFFANSTCEQMLVHCSTPLVTNKRKAVIRQPISPISIVGQDFKSSAIELNDINLSIKHDQSKKTNSIGDKQLSQDKVQLKAECEKQNEEKTSANNSFLNTTERNQLSATHSEPGEMIDGTAFLSTAEISHKINSAVTEQNCSKIEEQGLVESVFKDTLEASLNTSANALQTEIKTDAIMASPPQSDPDNFRVSLTSKNPGSNQENVTVIDLTESFKCNDQVSSNIKELQGHPVMMDEIVINLTLHMFSDKVNGTFDQSTERPRKSSMTDTDSSDIEIINSSLSSPVRANFRIPLMPLDNLNSKNVFFKTGKNWRRSLYQQKKDCVGLIESPKVADLSNPRHSIKIVPVASERYSRRKTALQNYAQNNLSTIPDESIEHHIFSRRTKLSLRSSTTVSAKEVVLQRCNQTEPVPFESLYPDHALENCRKIGEGVYGEVFLYTNQRGISTVMKIIPIESETIVNGEKQKKFHEIISEVVIASELCNLRKNRLNKCAGFCEVQRIACVKGRYPQKLTDLWIEYDHRKGSENDSPEVFDNDQLYIILCLGHAGQDLESFVFNNATCAVSMLKQVACSLAAAEEVLKFEHRDLHWGNVLLRASTDKNKKITFKLRGKEIEIIGNGIEATIIDFTLSRIEHQGVVIFNDLGSDPDLFIAEGDYQFDIYRLMKEKNDNDWRKYEPFTNILWLHYILRKSITDLRYKNTSTKVHKRGIEDLQSMERDILRYRSASEFVLSIL
ncbi:uncharacterized protein LOC143199771 [Rhynchophorus ferrugineus]|uniref:uncharacterized protein LOC143199771 n=1 Tax=Rhynchophorus ferrugineus TaxID=354439 RepID=UPI003FCE5693